jgi:hypothetical protein
MTESNQARATLLLALLFFSGLAGGHWLARYTAAPLPEPGAQPVLPDQPAAAEPAPRRDAPRGSAATPAPAPAPAVRTTPLPPRDQPVSAYFDELSRQAAAGDAAAARRLADDLHECATLTRQLDSVDTLLDRAERMPDPPGGADRPRRGMPGGGPRGGGSDGDRGDVRLRMAERLLTRAQASEQRCAGISKEQMDKSAELIRDAALAGDNQARLCYALAPNEWRRDTLSPGWADYAERWNGESTQMVRQAFEGGLPEAAAVLSAMYSPWQQRGGAPWNGQIGDDPYWAYAYAAVARDVMPPENGQRWNERTLMLSARLQPAQIAQAEAWARAARQRVDFTPALMPGGGDRTFCEMVRLRGGFR